MNVTGLFRELQLDWTFRSYNSLNLKEPWKWKSEPISETKKDLGGTKGGEAICPPPLQRLAGCAAWPSAAKWKENKKQRESDATPRSDSRERHEDEKQSIDRLSTATTHRSKFNANMNAIARQSAASASRALRVSSQKQQKRGIVNWMTNYPDKVR